MQAGLRVGELAALRLSDVTVNDRSGSIRVPRDTGLKAREIPLNAIGRRALSQYLADRQGSARNSALFLRSRDTAMPVRTIQGMIAGLARRARLKRIPVTANTLRHTFALGYLHDNPGQVVELAELLGHESRDMVSLDARPSGDELAAHSEHPSRNAPG